MTQYDDRGMRCRCGCGSSVTHTYRVDGGQVVVRRRQCLDARCRLVWHSQEVRVGDWPENLIAIAKT